MINKKISDFSKRNSSFLKRKSLNKKGSALFQILLVTLSLFAFSFLMSDKTIVSASPRCCERTVNNDGTLAGTCLNVDESNCSEDYLSAPTSCEYTSYCQSGTCYDSNSGICMQNTPKRTCDENEGATWDSRPISQVPQCQLGCCIIADQAAFVTLTRCKSLSAGKGVENIFRTDITSELDCIATAQAQDVGACVYEQDYERHCDFITRAECGVGITQELEADGNVSISNEKKFYKDFLCSNDNLATICSPQSSTTCYQGDVYWVDSCGNRENIFNGVSDAQKRASRDFYKGKIGNPEPNALGNCDYLLGTRCAKKSGFSIGAQKHECKFTNCSYDINGDGSKENLKNGESFCINPGKNGINIFTNLNGEGRESVGSRYFKAVCIDGEVEIEPCADYRNEICIEGSIQTASTPFSSATCRVNRWQDCTSQLNEDDCKDEAKRDCGWFPSFAGLVLAGVEEDGSVAREGVCVPKYSPGLDFWKEGSSNETCALANAKCEVSRDDRDHLNIPSDVSLENLDEIKWVEKDSAAYGSEDCGGINWTYKANQVCVAMGDCGGYVNYIGTHGKKGYNSVSMTWNDSTEEWDSTEITLENYVSNNAATFFPLTMTLIAGFTGMAVGGTGVMTEVVSGEFSDGPITKEYTVTNENEIKDESTGKFYYYNAESKKWKYEGSDVADYYFGNFLDNLNIEYKAKNMNTDDFTNEQKSEFQGLVGEEKYKEALSKAESYTQENTSPEETYSDSANTPSADTSEPEVPAVGVDVSNTNNLIGSDMALSEETSADEEESPSPNAYAGIVQNMTTKYSLNRSEKNELQLAYSRGDKKFKEELIKILKENGVNDEELEEVAKELSKSNGWDGDKLDWLNAGASLVAGAGAAWMGYQVGKVVSDLFGADDAQSAGIGAGIGAFTGTLGLLETFEVTKGASGNILLAGAIGITVFALTYAKRETTSYEFQCLPWEAPVGGTNCEVCNDDDIPCSEYRCRSLGANCEIVNAGTEKEKCVNVDPNDATPPVIYPDENLLSEELNYSEVVTNPPEPGFKIVYHDSKNGDGCIPSFTPFQFGITTRGAGSVNLDNNRGEPAQCKIDYKHTESFEEMSSYMGGSNLYKYSHTEKLILPNLEDLESAGFQLKNGEEMSFFIRCQDRSGNTNDAEFEVRFCIDDSPDTTPPIIETTSVSSGSCISAGKFSTNKAIFYTNEQAKCKWSDIDQSYENMQYEMIDEDTPTNSLFRHTPNLTGITREGTDYYIRCNDSSGNMMRESYKFSLRASTELLLKNFQPNGTEIIYGVVDPTPVELFVETSMGCDNGMSTCEYSVGNYRKDGNGYAEFIDTNNEDGVSTQRLGLSDGSHDVYVRCYDAGGNLIEVNSTIKVDIDPEASIVARVYKEEGMLKLVTVRESDCVYVSDSSIGCDYEFDEGTVMPYSSSTIHVAEWNSDKTYYIKCQDEYRVAGTDCSIEVIPTML